MEEQINPGRDGPEGMLYSSISFSIKIMQNFSLLKNIVLLRAKIILNKNS